MTDDRLLYLMAFLSEAAAAACPACIALWDTYEAARVDDGHIPRGATP